MKKLLLVLSAMLISACNMTIHLPTALEDITGTWVQYCQVDGDLSSKGIITIDEDGYYTEVIESFDNNECSPPQEDEQPQLETVFSDRIAFTELVTVGDYENVTEITFDSGAVAMHEYLQHYDSNGNEARETLTPFYQDSDDVRDMALTSRYVRVN